MGPLSRAAELGALPRPWLGWEVAGGETWDVQSDGQLLQLVQAVARACQVGWGRALCPEGWGRPRPWAGPGVASSPRLGRSRPGLGDATLSHGPFLEREPARVPPSCLSD